MNAKRWLFTWLVLLASGVPFAVAASPEVDLRGTVSLGTTGVPGIFTGTMTIRGWESASGRCLYLPLNDPRFMPGGVSIDYFRYRAVPADKLGIATGRIDLTPGPNLRVISPYLVEVSGSPSDMTLQFTAKMPLVLNRRTDVVFENFHPVLLDHCPTLAAKSEVYEDHRNTRITSTIVAPDEWRVVGPTIGPNQALPSARLAAALIHGYSERRLFVSGLEVVIFYRSASFLELLPTIELSLDSHMSWFGPFPYPRLVIIESGDLEKSDLPGIVTLNTPRQELFHSFQSQLLNWNHWVTAKMLAYQWYGAAIRPRTADDAWLVMGIADFATLMALKKNPTRYNLFNVFDFKRFILSLNYLEAQELAAGILNRALPDCPITDTEDRTLLPANRQHGYLFLRQAIAMRHLSSVAGEQTFQLFLKSFTGNALYKPLSPREFREGFAAMPSPFSGAKRNELAQILATWWINGAWPDYEFTSLEKTPLQDGRWLATARLKQLGGIDFPVQVQIKDSEGLSYYGLSVSEASGNHAASQVTEHEPVDVAIDPHHVLYDSDRFNNGNSSPDVKIFPGNATTFADDAYTVAWLPYPFRRPGEDMGVGVQIAILKHIKSTLMIAIESDTKGEKQGFSLQQRDRRPALGIDTEFALGQTIPGYRLAQAAVYRKPARLYDLELSPNAQVRHRSIKSDATTAVASGSIGLTVSTGEVLGCAYKLAMDVERSVPGRSFTYTRQTTSVDTGCQVGNAFQYDLRLFRGRLSHRGGVPQNLLFRPEDLGEARLRLDERNIDPVNDIATINNDVLVPFSVALPDNFLVVARKLRWRMFFDIGRSDDLDVDYRAAGTGVLIPFGGDITGVGSLALTRFTVLAVLYSSVNGEVNNKPRYIFDISAGL